jgi:hypothetical protein
MSSDVKDFDGGNEMGIARTWKHFDVGVLTPPMRWRVEKFTSIST